LSRALAANSVPSCGTSAIRARISAGSADGSGTPSMRTVPACGS
jgi:hypothetical protein